MTDLHLLFFLLAFSGSVLCWKALPVFACWIRSRRSGAPISLPRLWWMYFRNVPLAAVVDAYASARDADVAVSIGDLASHARSGGDARAVVHAYVETLRAGSRIEFSRVCEIELEDLQKEAMD